MYRGLISGNAQAQPEATSCQTQSQQPKSFRELNVQVIYGTDVEKKNDQHIDYQGINWSPNFTYMSRELFRSKRQQQFEQSRQSHFRLSYDRRVRMTDSEEYFYVNKFYQGMRPRNAHLQLINCVQAASHHDIYYLSEDKMKHCCTIKEQINVCDDEIQSREGQQNQFQVPFFTKFRPTCFSVDSTSFVQGGYSGGLFIKNIETGKSIYLKNITETESVEFGGEIVNYVQIYNNGQSGNVLTASNDKQVKIFDIQNPKIAKESVLCSAQVNIAKLNPNQPEILAVFCDKKEAEIMDMRSKQITATLKGHQDFGLALDWHPNGVQLATGNQDSTTRIWDLRNLTQQLHIIPSETGTPFNVKYNQTGSYLAFIECDDYLHIYNTKSDYNEYQLVDFFGRTTGLDFIDDMIYVGINANQHDGIMQLNLRKQYQTSITSSLSEMAI